MEKIKNAISKVLAWLNKAYQWLNKEGGMLHILACYAMMLTFTPIIGVWWATAITWAVAIGKEAYDIVTKRNTWRQSANDLVRDAIGWGCAFVTMLAWWLAIL